jgi:hypothetical protein
MTTDENPPTEKPPGQVAYEAYEKHFGRDGNDWNDRDTPDPFKAGWEAENLFPVTGLQDWRDN